MNIIRWPIVTLLKPLYIDCGYCFVLINYNNVNSFLITKSECCICTETMKH